MLSATKGWRSKLAKRPSQGSTVSGERSSTSARLATTVPAGSSAVDDSRGGEAAVHEHQPRRRVEDVGLDERGRHRVRIALRPVESPLGDRGDVGQPPLLLPEGGEAELREAPDRRPAHRPQPARIARPFALPLELGGIAADAGDGILSRRGHGHGPRQAPTGCAAGSGATSSQEYPFSSSSKASSLPPERTMRPSTSTWTWSGTM